MTSYCNQTVTVVKNNECCSPTKREEKYSVTITASDTWIMPAVTETTVLTIPNCNNILIGSWLWNQNVGYLEVVKYNIATGETVVRNIGFDGNAVAGTVFPSCMDFAVTAPVYIDTISDNVTCLASDFVSPAVGDCALMKVKSTANLRKDYIIAIDIYQYQVKEVIDNFTVKVCNYGLGKVGVIEANCDGKCVPVRAINANSPCLQDEVQSANAIAVCVGGESKILVGTEDGQIATWTNGSGEWQLINSNIEIDCTVTTNYVNIIAGNVGPYLLNVVTTAPFKVGDRITFNNEHDAYTVSEIVSDTQIRLLKNEAPTEDTVIDAGARLCIVDCCDWLPAMVETLEDRITNVEYKNNAQDQRLNTLDNAVEDLENNKQDKLTPASILSGSSIVTIANGVNVILDNDATISVDNDLSQYDNTTKHFVVDGANSSTTTGAVGVFAGHTDDNTTGDRTLNFNSIIAGTNISVTAQGSNIKIDNTMQPVTPGTTNSMANVGTGEGLIYKDGTNPFNLRSLKAGSGIFISSPSANDEEITITNTGVTFDHYSYIYENDLTINTISSGEKWNAKGKSASATSSFSITNPHNRPLNLFVYAWTRTAYYIGGADTNDATNHNFNDGWANLDISVKVTQKNGSAQSVTIQNTSIHSIISMEGQQSPYHNVNNTTPLLGKGSVSSIPANTTATFTFEYAIEKISDPKDTANPPNPSKGGKITWESSPHAHLRILAVLD